MNTKITTKGMHLTNEELIKVAKKVGKLSKYCKRVKDDSSIIDVNAEKRGTKKEQDNIKVTISVTLPKTDVLIADSRKDNAIEATDRAIAKLVTQVKKYKEKHSGKEMARKGRK